MVLSHSVLQSEQSTGGETAVAVTFSRTILLYCRTVVTHLFLDQYEHWHLPHQPSLSVYTSLSLCSLASLAHPKINPQLYAIHMKKLYVKSHLANWDCGFSVLQIHKITDKHNKNVTSLTFTTHYTII